MRWSPRGLVGATLLAALVSALATPSARAGPPADGFYRARSTDRTPAAEPVLGEALELQIDHAVVEAQDNENERFLLRLRVPHDPALSPPGALLLVVGGRTLVSSGAGTSGDVAGRAAWSVPSFGVGGRDVATAVGRFLGIAPRLRRHPGHRLQVAFLPAKPRFAPGDAVSVTFRVKNVGENTVAFEHGGRQRARRDNQYDFLARLDGRLVPDIDSNLHEGGEVGRRVLKPGEVFDEEVHLAKWFAFATPGLYEIVGTYALTLLAPETDEHVTVWEDHLAAYFLVEVEAVPPQDASGLIDTARIPPTPPGQDVTVHLGKFRTGDEPRIREIAERLRGHVERPWTVERVAAAFAAALDPGHRADLVYLLAASRDPLGLRVAGNSLGHEELGTRASAAIGIERYWVEVKRGAGGLEQIFEAAETFWRNRRAQDGAQALSEESVARVEAEVADPDGVVNQEWIGRLVRARLKERGESPLGLVDTDRQGPRWDLFLTPGDRRRICERLAAALPVKRGRAREEALRTLMWLDAGEVLRHEGAAALRHTVRASWQDFGMDFRQLLLREHWTTLRDPAFASLLKAELEAGGPRSPWHVDDVGSLALLRYADLDPVDGRRRILEDIRRDSPRFGSVALTSLAEDHLGEVDDLFRAPPEVARRREGFEKHVALAERYGGPSILPTVLALLEERRWACDILESLLGCVLKHDRARGLGLVERAARTRGPEETSCYRYVLRVLKRDWGPDARLLVESFRNDPDPEVQRTVSDLLSS